MNPGRPDISLRTGLAAQPRPGAIAASRPASAPSGSPSACGKRGARPACVGPLRGQCTEVNRRPRRHGPAALTNGGGGSPIRKPGHPRIDGRHRGRDGREGPFVEELGDCGIWPPRPPQAAHQSSRSSFGSPRSSKRRTRCPRSSRWCLLSMPSSTGESR